MVDDEITILVTDADLNPVHVLDDWQQLDTTHARNAPGPGSVVAPSRQALMAALQPGARIAVYRGDSAEAWHSGPLEKPGPRDRSVDGDNAGGLIKLSWVTHEMWLGARRVYPNPALAWTAQTAEQWTVAGVVAETVLRTLVDTQLGPGALPNRRVPRLQLAPANAPLLGAAVTDVSRFEWVSDVARRVALAGGNLGWRIRHIAQDLLFGVSARRDLSASVRFSLDLDNLLSYSTDPEAPTVTAALVAGQGTGTARPLRERTAVSGWGRFEDFVDASSATTTAQLDAAGDEALAAGAESANLSAEAVETTGPGLPTFGRDFWLNDLVTVELDDGVPLVDAVTAARLQAPGNGTSSLAFTIGTPDAASDETTRVVRDLYRRLGRLETR
ncbi:Gp37-like protein [Micromonospora aurantiaca (nom. illeg.)]|uniref:Gp37-like protein n=1 Tax=Micromonospora aurantiaca (nom. illeg.) TaxID=47850 RepID=UPI003DA27B55